MGKKKVVIVESPKKAKAIGAYLGGDFDVAASKGHVRDLPEDEFAVDVEHDFEPTYRVMPGSRKTVRSLKKKAKDAEAVYLAPDPDREGEAIAWHVQQALNLPEDRVHRVTFNEVTRDAVRDAFRHPHDISMNLVDAQQARRILDRIVGYELSPLISRKIVRGLSAGRVQSVALRLICDREREIEAFEPEEYWRIAAVLGKEDGKTLEAELKKLGGKKLDLSNEKDANAVVEELKDADYRVKSVEEKKSRSRPAAPFTTSTMQQAAGSRLRYSAARTMRTAQELYEGIDLGKETEGLITYMRTDSTRVSKQALGAVRGYVEEEFGDKYVPNKPNFYKSGKGAQGAHEAIRPTDVRRRPEDVKKYMSKSQFKLYDLIWRRFVASQMTPTVYLLTKVEIEAGRGTFRASGRRMLFDGYSKVMSRSSRKKDQTLPPLEEGEELSLKELLPTQHFTQPPNRYTEATLVKELEKQGIGRPSTYAPIISTLKRRNYVNKKKGTIYPTDLGKAVVDKLVKHFPREMDVQFTSKMEERLDQIEDGKEQWQNMLRDFYGQFHNDVEEARENMTRVSEDGLEEEVTCEQCGKPMVLRFSRTGQKFLGCSGFPECRNTISLSSDDDAEESEHKCPKCGSPMLIKKGRRGGKYLACSAFPECRNIMGLDKEGNPVELEEREYTGIQCPRCGGKTYVEEGSKEDEQEFTPRTLRCSKCSFRQELSTLEDALQQSQIYADRPAPECPECGSAMEVKRGRKGLFLGCSNYPDCKETSNIPDADVPDPVPTYERCDKCESIMVLRWGRYGQFLGCSRFPRCRNIWRLSTGKKKECPREDCDGRLIKKIDQDENEYFGCSRYPKCDFKTEELPDKKAGSKK